MRGEAREILSELECPLNRKNPHSDYQYYTSLEKYYPLCYSGKEIHLVNVDWHYPYLDEYFLDWLLCTLHDHFPGE